MGLPAMVDEAGAGYEAKVPDLERWAQRLREESGEDWGIDHLPPEIPEGAVAERVGTWPNGEPMVVITYWVPAEDQG